MKWSIARRQGISAAVGMALAGKIDKKDCRVYAVLDDGEIQEGQVWEAAMAAGHHDGLLKLIDEMEDAMFGDAVALYRTAADEQKRRRISLWNVWIRECRSC